MFPVIFVSESHTARVNIKGTWKRTGFSINRFGIGPIHYILSRSDFGFEFSEIFVFEKRIPDSTIRGVGDSPTQRYGESFLNTNISAN